MKALSTHLAELYGVETRALNQAVNRFPEDFMFQLTVVEAEQLVSQNVIPHKKHLGGSSSVVWHLFRSQNATA